LTGGGSSIPAVQRLLAVLAAGRWCAEIGTAFGEGAVAMASTAASVVTVEIDPERAALALRRLLDASNVELLVGDGREELAGRGPFGFFFYDAGPPYDFDTAVGLLEQGGLLVKDDLTPGRSADDDPVRAALFGNPRLVASELQVAPDMAVVLAARR
jgi:predicted O-methyltransferase YrrM